MVTQIRGVSYKPTDIKSEIDGIPILRANNIQDDGINLDKLVYIDSKKVHEEQYLKKGDIVICASSGSKNLVGKAATYNKNEKASFGAFCKVVRVNESENLCKEFVQQYFQSKLYRNAISELSIGTNINNIKTEHIDALEINVPSLPEQQKIAAHLDSIQSAIDNKKQQLQQLDEMVKSKFVEMFGEVIENTKNLPLFLFGDICFLKAGDFTPAKDIKDVKSEEFPYPCFGGNGIRGYVDNFTKEGDFPIIGRQGALCGNVQFASGRFRNTEHAVLVKPLKDGINPLWLYKLLENLNLNRYQTGAAQPGLSVKTLELIKIPIADFELQNTFAEYVQKIDSAKLIIKTQLADLQELLDSKMDEYFGE